VDKFTKLDLNSITSNNRMNIFNCILEAKEINRAVIAKKPNCLRWSRTGFSLSEWMYICKGS